MLFKLNLFFLFFISTVMAIAHENSTVIFHVYQIDQSKLDKDKDRKKEDNKETNKGGEKKDNKETNKGGEKKDTASTDITVINQKLDSVLILMNAKVIPYIDAQNNIQNNTQAAEIAKLNVKINQLQSELGDMHKLIKQHSDDKTKTDNELVKLREQVSHESELLAQNKVQLKQEIDALQKQSYKIDETILKSIGDRLKLIMNADPAWIKTYEEFKVKRDLLWKADEYLSKPYDPKLKQLIVEINAAFSKGQQFAELSKEKLELSELLSGYCEKTEEMKSLLNIASKLNDLKEDRDKRINNSLYFFVGYDYLVSIILTNQTNYNHNPIKNTITDCE
jgi:small-conductance mechanosensitive channel